MTRYNSYSLSLPLSNSHVTKTWCKWTKMYFLSETQTPSGVWVQEQQTLTKTLGCDRGWEGAGPPAYCPTLIGAPLPCIIDLWFIWMVFDWSPSPCPRAQLQTWLPMQSWTNLFIRQAAHESESVSVYILLKLMVFFIHSLDRDVSKSFHKPALLTFSPQGAWYAMYEFRLGTVLSSFRRSSITDLWSSSAEYFYIRSQISQIPKRGKIFKFLSFFISIFGNVLYFARI